MEKIVNFFGSEKLNTKVYVADKQIIELYNKEKAKHKNTLCDPVTWAKRKSYLAAGQSSKTEKICIPKEKCSKYLVIKITTPFNESQLKQINNEINILEYISKNIGNKYFVKMIDHFTCKCKCPIVSPYDDVIVQIMEYAGPTLNYYLYEKVQPLNWWRCIFLQIIEALSQLDKHKIAHRDLHSGNILISGTTKKPLIKIIDFGLTKKIKKIDVNKHYKLNNNLQNFATNFLVVPACPDEISEFINIIKNNPQITATEILEKLKSKVINQ